MNRIAILKLMAFAIVLQASNAYADLKAGPIGGVGGNKFEKTLSSDERICGGYINHTDGDAQVFFSARIHGIQLEVCDNFDNRYLTEQYGSTRGIRSYFSLGKEEKIIELFLESSYFFGLHFNGRHGGRFGIGILLDLLG